MLLFCVVWFVDEGVFKLVPLLVPEAIGGAAGWVSGIGNLLFTYPFLDYYGCLIVMVMHIHQFCDCLCGPCLSRTCRCFWWFHSSSAAGCVCRCVRREWVHLWGKELLKLWCV